MNTCARCGRQIPVDVFETLCLTCQVVTTVPSISDADADVRGTKKMKIVGAIVLVTVGAIVGALVWRNRVLAAETLAREYPVALTAEQSERAERDAAAWRKVRNKLVDTMKSFGRVKKAQLPHEPAPCRLAQKTLSDYEVYTRNGDHERFAAPIAGVLDQERYVDRRLVDNEHLVDDVIARLDGAIAAGERGRFRGAEARDSVLDVLGQDSLVVVSLTADEKPTLEAGGYVMGYRAGTAYVFDRATGDLACMGAFEAESSERVVGLQGAFRDNLADAFARDLEANTDRAIAAAVRAMW